MNWISFFLLISNNPFSYVNPKFNNMIILFCVQILFPQICLTCSKYIWKQQQQKNCSYNIEFKQRESNQQYLFIYFLMCFVWKSSFCAHYYIRFSIHIFLKWMKCKLRGHSWRMPRTFNSHRKGIRWKSRFSRRFSHKFHNPIVFWVFFNAKLKFSLKNLKLQLCTGFRHQPYLSLLHLILT